MLKSASLARVLRRTSGQTSGLRQLEGSSGVEEADGDGTAGGETEEVSSHSDSVLAERNHARGIDQRKPSEADWDDLSGDPSNPSEVETPCSGAHRHRPLGCAAASKMNTGH